MTNSYRYKKEINGVEYESTLNVTNKNLGIRPYSAMSWENGNGGYTQCIDIIEKGCAQSLREAVTKDAIGELASDAMAQTQSVEKQQETEASVEGNTQVLGE